MPLSLSHSCLSSLSFLSLCEVILSSSRSFVFTRFPVPKSVFTALHQRLESLDENERRFVLHVLLSNLNNLNKIREYELDGWLDVGIDLPCQWIRRHFTAKFRATQIDPSIVTFEDYSTSLHQCRKYLVSADLRDLILRWIPNPADDNDEIVNLFDGKPYTVQAPQEWSHGIYTSKVIRTAVRAIEGCPFNYRAVAEHLDNLKKRANDAATASERARYERILQNDNACAMRICPGTTPDKEGFAVYKPEYRTIYTGRIVEVGGGSQSCSRAMKDAMFSGNRDVRNYDLKRAQAFILLQELEDADLPRDWTEKYVHSVNANEERAAALGISKDAFKTCLYATVMGATHSTHWNRKANDIFHRMVLEFDGDTGMAQKRTMEVHAALGPLKGEVDGWHKHLMTSAHCARVDSARKKLRTLKNACGQHFALEGDRADKLARKAAAFILQGQEAAFIHRLTALGKRAGFVPISNQHDGIVVLGSVPDTAVTTAAASSGLRYAELEVKPFL